MSMLRFCVLRLALLCAAAGPAGAATFTVTKTANTTDGLCNADCSLSEAIVAANANPGADTVAFAIPGGGVKIIPTGTSGFPNITDTLTIDGYTQPESATNTLTGASNNAVIRIELTGTAINELGDAVLDVEAPNSVIRGVAVRGQNFLQVGVSFRAGSDGSALRGCFIGTNSAGTTDLANGNGIEVRGANITIGGTAAANRNVISGNFGGVVVIDSLAVGTQVQGNLIGIGASGLPLGNSGDGVVVAGSAPGATIGGTTTAARNFIANNTDDGIRVNPTVRGVRILGNLIYANNDRGIDLGGDGFNANDPGDLDSGANALQNSPTLQNAAATDDANTVLGFDVVRATGFLESTPSTGFRIELFEGDTGQDAELLVDTQNVTTDARGFATIRFESKGTVAPGRVLVATATNNTTNDTSEFSSAGVRTGFEVNTVEDTDDGNCTSDCSLREAINAANALFGIDSIVFALDGALPHTIVPLTELPTLTQPVQIDGYSQPGTRYNSAPTGSNAIIGVELSGKALDSGSVGLRFGDGSGNGSVRGLAIVGFEGGMGGGGAGISIEGSLNTFGIRISGNFLGPDASGLTAPTQGAGLVMTVEPGSYTIGDSSAVAPASPTQRNLISGNTFNGLLLRGGTSSAVRGNAIGVAADGSPLGNGGNGILLISTFFVPIGGTTARDANEIANNGGAGVRLIENNTSGSMLGNVFHDNVALAIDLGVPDGVTPNDANDIDSGPNDLQNFPVLNLAAASNGLTTVGGTFNSTPSSNFRIEFYASPECHPSGNGEGRQFLGFLNAATAADGNATLSGQIPGLPLAGYDQLTATAIGSARTSEFSACLPLPYTDPLFVSSFE